jgi:FkbM family methyltransferase
VTSSLALIRAGFRAFALYRSRLGAVGAITMLRARLRLRSAADGTPVEVRLPGLRHPVTLRTRTSDVEVLDQLLVYGELDGVRPDAPRFIVDAGANIGLATLLFANRYPDATIVAVEVDTNNAAVLRRNVARYANIHVVNAALWHHDGFVRITNPSDPAWAFTVEEASEGEAGAIPATTIPTILDRFGASRIDLLKVDIEGSERELLGGGRAAVWIDRVEMLAIELHDRYWPGCSDALRDATGLDPASLEHCGEYVIVRRVDRERARPVAARRG